MKYYQLYNGLLLLLLLFLNPLISLAQPYLIQSKEGYSNVRNDSNAKSKVLDQLKNNTIVLVDQVEDQDLEKEQWIKILYYENLPFSIVEISDEKSLKTGFIHKSQLTAVNKLERPSKDEFSMQYVSKDFSLNDKKIVYQDESASSIKSINGIYYYLGDCGIPKEEIYKAEAKINGKKLVIPSKLYLGIISATNNFEYFKVGKVYLAVQEIGDGACANHVVWVFEKDKLSQRFVGWEF